MSQCAERRRSCSFLIEHHSVLVGLRLIEENPSYPSDPWSKMSPLITSENFRESSELRLRGQGLVGLKLDIIIRVIQCNTYDQNYQ